MVILLTILCPIIAKAQEFPVGAPQYLDDPPQYKKITGHVMAIRIEANGDTMFLDTIDPIWIFPKGHKAGKDDWRKYYKLVYNFNKVYPYALVGRKMMAQVDSTIASGNIRKSERNVYVKDVERELLRLFEKDIRKMTITQGMVLLRLVDRECGMSGYDIIKTYESGFVAGFWQLVAKIFSQDLKTRYDPKDKDAKIEQLVKIWDSGNWNRFYYSVFFEYPVKTEIKTDRLSSDVKRKETKESPRQNKDKAKR